MSVTAAQGFVAAGIACGIKESGAPDLALVATDDGRPVPAAAVFTANKAKAAPVQVSAAHLAATGGQAAAVVLNSGNANAATGDEGRATAERMTALVARELGCDATHVLVCSTGLIGIPLPLAPIEKGMAPLAAARAAAGGPDAARAIMTTDTHPKEVVVSANGITVGGMAKGAAMLAPNMATMLAVLTTDAVVDPTVAKGLLQHAVAHSFNTLSVDGCTSTNDTVIVLANGRSGVSDDAALRDLLTEACSNLAAQMAGDAEGATKVVHVTVTGARDDAQAAAAARKIAESQLVKCSFYGEDPYWGRVVSEAGSAGVDFDPDAVSVTYGDVTVCRNGVEIDHDAAAVKAHLTQRDVRLTVDLALGDGKGSVLTNDLTHAYIDENMRTS
ncbi:MAG TPA: bifunctional glutamate N-acetyltransferase/amino-acid acetyltransferase ArgJ [Acidimicrobiales bacterium]|nr:bifunctional glutamate N-acetyltransferase/amino-acid acetyltransferase ArgJ [Acidimicrobiales bacterium]